MIKHILFFWLLFFCSFYLQAQDEKRFIFPADKKLSRFPEDKDMIRYTPSANEIDSIETTLRRVFNSLERQQKEFSLEDYYRQYMGYYQNGQRMIHVAGSCIKTPFFETDMVTASSRNTCFFEATISLPSRQLDSFKFNKTR